MNMKQKSFFPNWMPVSILLALTCSCSEDDGGATEAGVGSVMDRGAGGSAAGAASPGGAGGATAGGNASGNEVGGSNGIAMAGANGSSSGVSQGGSAGAAMGGAGGSAGAAVLADAGTAADSGAAAVSYAKDIQPILLARCSPCHATDNDGRHNAATSYADAVRVSARIVREISSGGMPESGNGNVGCNGGDPGDPGCVSAADFELIQRWVAAGTPE